MKSTFFSILTILAFCQCQPTQTPEKQTFQAYVRYLDDVAQLRAEATLRGPDSLPVQPPGGIRYKGQEMSLRPLQGATYQYQRNGVADETAHFGWVDAAGRRHDFDLPLRPVSGFGFGPGDLVLQKPDTLRWAGEPLDNGETMVLMWQNLASGQTVPMEIYSSAPLAEIAFPAVKLAELSPGEWSLYLVRRKLVRGEAGGVPASGIAEYYSSADTIRVR